MSTTSAVDPSRCPLCAQPNACQIAAGSATCWCFDATVPASVLSRVPAEAQGVACVCRGCAAQPEPSAPRAGASPSDPPDARAASSEDRRLSALRWLKR